MRGDLLRRRGKGPPGPATSRFPPARCIQPNDCGLIHTLVVYDRPKHGDHRLVRARAGGTVFATSVTPGRGCNRWMTGGGMQRLKGHGIPTTSGRRVQVLARRYANVDSVAMRHSTSRGHYVHRCVQAQASNRRSVYGLLDARTKRTSAMHAII